MAASRPAAAARGRLAAPAAAAAAAVAAAALGGCGGGSGTGAGDGAGGPPAAGRQGQVPSPYVPPPGTPARGTGPADPERVRVIRTWVRRLRDGDVAGAARTFADGALVQNGTPVVRLRSFAERRLFIDEGFPCGARVADAEGAPRGFTVVRFTLTPRVGGSCPGPGGGSAAAAIRVRDGRITEWYRLPDPEGPPDAEAPLGPAGPPV
jgi:hypothetical protein